jgi:regulator of nucleoside diphosphate kinase
MATEPHFQLTTKDHAVLQAILERHRGPRGPFVQLLERKVRDSSIYFRDDIPPGVVTLDTRLTYYVNGIRTGPHLIVQSAGADLAPFALSIHTLRGLALLGMAERNAMTLDLGKGVFEELRIDDVLFQPEADARVRMTSKGIVQGDSAGRVENIVSFRRPAHAQFGTVHAPDDDDPGPRAA